MTFIRTKDRKSMFEAIDGDDTTVVQVFGPPMVGKSELIKQTLEEIQDANSAKSEHTVCYSFWCKNIYSLQELFSEMIRVMIPNQHHTLSKERDQIYDKEQILRRIKRSVHKQCYRHVFVFHKCESFSEHGKGLQFLCFLGEILNLFYSGHFKVNLVFSTYKQFHFTGSKARLVHVGMFIDPWDIMSLLHHYSPGSDVIAYVDICQRYLCLPEPIVQMAVQYASKNVPTHHLPEHYTWRRSEFYYPLFEQRVQEVYTWLAKDEVELIMMMTRTGLSPFCIETVQNMLHNDHQGCGYSTYQKLVDKMVIEQIGQSGYFIVHPLALYQCAVCVHSERDLLGHTNSYTHFIGHVMTKAEVNREKHGIRGLTYGCHLSEWRHIRELCQTAIQTGSLNDILKVAVFARRLITVVEPNECKQFYMGLFNTAQLQGSSREVAVIEACLGHSLASGADINFKEAMKHLDSALETLKERGPTYFYKWALRRKAIILFRKCDYPKSLKYFQRADTVHEVTPLSPSDHQTLSVSALQEEEEQIVGEIYETIPVIFKGEYKTALDKCCLLNETINERYEHHPDYQVLLNNIGLTLHRGTNDLKGALFWYLKSLKVRSQLVRICPQNMLVTLNHVAEIKALTGDLIGAEKDLQKAISIIRESYWYHHNTAQILTSLADVKFKLKNFQEAFEFATEAEEILRKVNKQHDLRLQVNLGLVHYTLLLYYFGDVHHWSSSPFRTIEHYIDVIDQLGLSIKSQMSDHGHHYMMSAYEHGMVVNWGVCEDRLKTYRGLLVRHVEDNSVVKDGVEMGGTSKLLADHGHFLEYVKNTEAGNLKLGTLLEHLNRSCTLCQSVSEMLDNQMWLADCLSLLGPASVSPSCVSPESVPTAIVSAVNKFTASVSAAIVSLSSVSPASVSTTSVSPASMCPASVSPATVSLASVSTASVSPSSMSLSSLCPAHVSPAHVSPAHVSPAHVSPAHVSPAAVSPAHVSPAHVSPAAVSPAHVSPAHVSPAAVSPKSVSNVGLLNYSSTLSDRAMHNADLVTDSPPRRQLTDTPRPRAYLSQSISIQYSSATHTPTFKNIPNNELPSGSEILDNDGMGTDCSLLGISSFETWSDAIATGCTGSEGLADMELNSLSSSFFHLSSSECNLSGTTERHLSSSTESHLSGSSERHRSGTTERHLSGSSESHLSATLDDKGTSPSSMFSSEEYVWVSSPEN